LIEMVQYSRFDHSWGGDLYLRGMIDGYNREKKRIERKRRESEEKDVERRIGGILSVIKEAVVKELEEVTNKWKEVVLEKDKIIAVLQKELEEEINGRRSECEEIRKEMIEQRKLIEEEVEKERQKIDEEVNKRIENERNKTEIYAKNWRKVEEIVGYDRRRNKEEVVKIWLEMKGIKEERTREKILKEEEGEKIEKEREITRQKQLEEIRKERSRELEDFVRKGEWMESKGKMWETIQERHRLAEHLFRIILGYLSGPRQPDNSLS